MDEGKNVDQEEFFLDEGTNVDRSSEEEIKKLIEDEIIMIIEDEIQKEIYEKIMAKEEEEAMAERKRALPFVNSAPTPKRRRILLQNSSNDPCSEAQQEIQADQSDEDEVRRLLEDEITRIIEDGIQWQLYERIMEKEEARLTEEYNANLVEQVSLGTTTEVQQETPSDQSSEEEIRRMIENEITRIIEDGIPQQVPEPEITEVQEPEITEVQEPEITEVLEPEITECRITEEYSKIQIPEDLMPEEETNDSPIEQVRMTVSPTDDPTLPCLTFRTWVLGLISCILLAFMNKFLDYRQYPMRISSVCMLVLVFLLGRLMERALPKKSLRIPLTRLTFSLNPGPFNMKEHVLIIIFANSGSSSGDAVRIITMAKAFYHRNFHPVAAWLLIQTTQMLGYGLAGLFRKYLVDSPYMWWPSNLVQVSLFRALHDAEIKPKRKFTMQQFFLMVIGSSFAYAIVPNYFFPSISALSFVCWIWKYSVTAQQIGSGLHGLGIGSFGLDWFVASYLGSPLAAPGSTIVNILTGFALTYYLLLPIAYWTDIYKAKRFPIIDGHPFDSSGASYNISKILNSATFKFNKLGYEAYSKINLSIFSAINYGLSLATISATLSHVALFHGSTIWRMWTQTRGKVHNQKGDVHTRLMTKNYEPVPLWWFYIIMLVPVALALLLSVGRHFQLPYWGVLLAIALALFLTLPIGVITATTDQQPGVELITQYLFGYLYPGMPIANVAFKTYSYTSITQAISFLADFKLGHYMKIPPKSMFIVQLVGMVVSATVYFGTAWWLLESVDHICDPKILPKSSPWTCPGDDTFYSSSIIWGLVGPLRIFGRLGIYDKMNWFLLIGLLAPLPVWVSSRIYPDKDWIKLINMPIIIGATQIMPAARSVNFITWGVMGIIFNFYVYKKFKTWWARHNYVLSAGLDVGAVLMSSLVYFSLQKLGINGIKWWGLNSDDHCPLASCPTASGVVAKGC